MIRNGGSCPRCVDDHPEQRELPALLLELPGHECDGFQSAASSSTTRKASTGSTRPARAWTRRHVEGAAGRPTDRCRRRLRLSAAGAPTRPSGAWAGSTTRTTWRSRATASPSCCPATMRSIRRRRSRRSTRTSRTTPTPFGDAGTLYAFVPDEAYADVNDYYDFADGTTARRASAATSSRSPRRSRPGEDADRQRRRRRRTSRRTLAGSIPEPPTDGTWQRPPGAPRRRASPGSTVRSGSSSTGATSNNVFQFLRIEDIAVDKRPGMSNVVYLADSGRGSGDARTRRSTRTVAPSARRTAGSGRWSSTRSIPTKVLSLSILIEGDDNPVKTLDEIHQPDNLETTVNGLYITEDPGSSQQFTLAEQSSAARAPRPLGSGSTSLRDARHARRRRQGRPVGRRRPDRRGSRAPRRAAGAPGRRPAIVDVSSIFGPGKFLINVQAHTPVRRATAPRPTGRTSAKGVSSC